MQSLVLAQSALAQAHDWMWPVGITLAIVLAVALLLIYPAMVLRKYVRIMIHILDDRAPLAENGAPEGNGHHGGLVGEEVSFRAVDGHGLVGVHLARREGLSPKGLIIFAHEFGTDRSSCVRYARPLLKAGYDVFALDFRGHGGSPPEQGYHPRQWPSDRERADMLGAIAYAGSWLEAQGRPTDVGLFGISRGGGAAILASIGIPCVKAIVTDGAFSSDSVMEYLMRRFATIFAKIRIVAENHPPTFWRFLRWLLFRECHRKFGCQFPSVRKTLVKLRRKPILFIHGVKDSYIPIAQSQALYELAEGPKYLWSVPGAAHNGSIAVATEEYGRRVVAFLDEHLAVKSTRDDRVGPLGSSTPTPVKRQPGTPRLESAASAPVGLVRSRREP